MVTVMKMMCACVLAYAYVQCMRYRGDDALVNRKASRRSRTLLPRTMKPAYRLSLMVASTSNLKIRSGVELGACVST